MSTMNDNRRGTISMSPGGSPKTGARIGWFFVGLGLLLMVVGGGFALKRQRFLSQSTHTQGTVTAMSAHTSTALQRPQPSPPFSPSTTKAARSGQKPPASSTSPASYHVGDTIDVYYSPSNPSDAEVNGFFSLWGGSVIIGGIGLFQFLLGFACAKVFTAAAKQQGDS